ncbi:P-loop containing nucleoside triphosphate hydrolase [Glarea lozoyensis ATCC 20868]|uniref:p-loop containing nucleoside triphosphate hydrolase n=1 Tax=Glarea lozoyensis (strain ATCC 20868 / MF5171) TaxID=1116229 RepID=S3DMA6_GLAL2|nr:P-loop containing nucleoside triphosphate hydrolase [Glarea lozoyensis ATCC 20868]EPE27653.1 P-loop containing nucleoside triphosphate hydrolase [Glarea lozoyensis ATCC 20868]
MSYVSDYSHNARRKHDSISISLPLGFKEGPDASQPDATKYNTAQSLPSWRCLFSFAKRKHIPTAISAAAWSIASAASQPVTAILYGKLFTEITGFGLGRLTAQQFLHNVSTWCIAVAITAGCCWVVNGASLSSWMIFGELQGKSARSRTFSSMLEKELQWYDLKEDGIGSLLVRIQTQIRELQLAISQPLGFVFTEICGASIALGIAFYFSWKLTLMICATIPFAMLLLSWLSRGLGGAIEDQKAELARASKSANTAISSITVVKAFNGQDTEVWQYCSIVKAVASKYLVQARANALQYGFTKFLMIGLFVQGFWYGLILIRQGLSTGNVLTTFYCCLYAMQSAEIILPQWMVLKKGMSAGHTLQVLTYESQIYGGPGNPNVMIKPEFRGGDIEFKGVSFAYPSNVDQQVLKRVSLFFPAGETTYVIGKSGSGKSTIGNILMKYYAVNRDDVCLDGKSINDLDTEWLRKNVSLVQQENHLFNETILQNIAFGKRERTTNAEIEVASKTADLMSTILNLPDGYATVVGSNGVALSGGQQQRVAIARARLRDSPILILDEATSALDKASRERVMEEIRRWRRGKTTIIITHDVSQILHENYVYVLEKGSVVEEGYKKKLANQMSGRFASFLGTSGIPENTAPKGLGISGNFQHFEQSNVVKSNKLHRTGSRGTRRLSKFLGIGEPSLQAMGSPNLASHRFSLGNPFPQSSLSQLTEHWSPSPVPQIPQNYHLSPRQVLPGELSPQTIQEEEAREYQPWSKGYQQSIQYSPNNTESTPMTDIRRQPSVNPSSTYRTQSKRRKRTSIFGFEDVEPLHSDDPSRPVLAPSTSPFNMHASIAKATRPISDESSYRSTMQMVMEERDAQKEAKKRKRDINNLPPGVSASIRLILSTIWPTFAWKDRIVLIFGFVNAFIVAAATPVFAFLFAQLLSTFYTTKNQTAEATKWALVLLGLAIVDGFSAFFTHYALEHCGQEWVNALRVEALKRVLAQPKAWFDMPANSTASLNDFLDRNAEEMRNLLGRFAGPVFTVAWLLSISITWSFILSWKLTLVALSVAPIMFVATRIFHLVSLHWEQRTDAATAHLGSVFTETFSNIRVVRALTLEKYFTRKHEQSSMATFRVGIRRATYSGLLYGLTDMISVAASALIFYYGSILISNSEANQHKCFNLPLYQPRTLTDLKAQKDSQVHFQSASKTSTSPTQANPPHIRSLKNFNLTILPGTITTLVGPSGSGKSTITSLLLSLYPPDSPTSLTFASHPISTLNTTSLRNHLAYVPQQSLLFPTTIHQNIIYGLPEISPLATLSCATQACIDAGIHEFIVSLPNGYHTLLGDGGMGLSGGQAQRICIARALVRRPKVLVLDEATSALDAVSARGVRDVLVRLRGRGTAVVCVSHDVEMMRVADWVVVVEDGAVVEEGGFEELVRRRGRLGRLIGVGGR